MTQWVGLVFTDRICWRGLLTVAMVALLFVSAGLTVRAESISLASLSYERVPNAELDFSGNEDRELKSTAQTTTFKFAVPLLLQGKKTMLLNFFTLRSLNQSYSNADSAMQVFRPENLYTLKYGLVFLRELNPKWKLAVLVQPSFLSDFKGNDAAQLLLRGGFLFERTVSKRLRYSIGLGFSDDYGSGIILPVFRLKWKNGDAWQLDLDLPSKAVFWRRLSSRLRIGAEAKVTGGHFTIGEDVDLGGGVSTRDGRVRYSILNLGPALSFRLMEGAFLILNGGYSAFRKFEVWDAADIKQNDFTFESNPFFKATVSYQVGG